MAEPDLAEDRAHLARVLREIEAHEQLYRAQIARRAHLLHQTDASYEEDNLPRSVVTWDDAAELSAHLQLVHQEQQALAAARAALARLERLRSQPFFGRVDFREEGQETPERIYIGVVGLEERATATPLVYDWRAPIASLFYDFGPGPAAYACPAGQVRGVLERKRQFEVVGGEIRYAFDTDLTVFDDVLKQLLARGASPYLRSIVATIQREQNRVIRDEEHDAILVLGAAGSGKTSVALQRVAYVLYRERERTSASDIVIFSPTSLFSSYISRVLPELGEAQPPSLTFAELAERHLGPDVRVETLPEQVEAVLQSEPREAELRRVAIRYKESAAFLAVLERFAADLPQAGVGFRDLWHGAHLLVRGEELERVFRSGPADLPLRTRAQRVRARVEEALRQVRGIRLRELTAELENATAYLGTEREIERLVRARVERELEQLEAHWTRQVGLDPLRLYRRLFADPERFARFPREAGVRPEEVEEVRRRTLAKLREGTLEHEDIAPVLLLASRLIGQPAYPRVRHVVVDEAQDYGASAWKLMGEMFPRGRFTVVGDPAQRLHGEGAGIAPEEVLRLLGARAGAAVTLERSYRSTREILALAGALVGRAEAPAAVRSGPRPRLVVAEDREQLVAAMEEDVRRWQQAGAELIGVIARTGAEASEAAAALRRRLPVAELAVAGKLAAGVTVLPVALAKGLEFDAVLVYGADRFAWPAERQVLYVALTRALTYLGLYAVREPDYAAPVQAYLEAERKAPARGGDR